MGRSQYIINIGGLPAGIHDYEFGITGPFFKETEYSEIESATVQVNVTLAKQNNLLQLHFELDGTVGITCDRCTKAFDFPVSASEDLVVRHGNPAESSDEILVVPEGQDEVDISHYLYEYITLAIPARRVPCEIDETLYTCDKETLQKLDNLSAGTSGEQNEINPLWEKLNKIKFNNNN